MAGEHRKSPGDRVDGYATVDTVDVVKALSVLPIVAALDHAEDELDDVIAVAGFPFLS